MSADPFTDPDFQEWARHVREDVAPRIAESALTISLVPAQVDVKFAVELGYSIMLDKPIIAIVEPGTRVPDHLVRVADLILEGRPGDPGLDVRLRSAIEKLAVRRP